jgi:Ca-activated chloride channel family protein
MTLSLKLEGSHKHSFSSEIRFLFKVLLIPERVEDVNNFHYIVLIDTSGSMSGMKITMAKEGAKNLLRKVPKGNKVTLLSFSKQVEFLSEASEPEIAIKSLDKLEAEGPTPLYTALESAIRAYLKHGMPGRVILLTDGKPTDRPEASEYSNLQIPDGLEVVTIGVGDDYNEAVLKTLAESSNGIFYHLTDPLSIPDLMLKSAPTEVAGKNVTVGIEAERQVKLLNYSGSPVRISAVENTVRILGETTLQSSANGQVLRVSVTYEEPAGGEVKRLEGSLLLTPAKDRDQFLSGLNSKLIQEYRYFELLRKYETEISSMDVEGATKTVSQLSQLANETRSIELEETTKRLRQILETTKRLGSPEVTKRIQKEVASEVTKKLRGG